MIPDLSRRVPIAVDGSCLKNPGGAGGWAWFQANDRWAAGGVASSTNNRMELTAVIEALSAVPAEQPVLLVADSKYVIDALTKWLPGWRRRHWKTASGSPVANQDLIVAAADLLAARDVTFRWVRGHNGHHLNEQADHWARRAAEATKARSPVPSGPGWTTPPG